MVHTQGGRTRGAGEAETPLKYKEGGLSPLITNVIDHIKLDFVLSLYNLC